MRSFAIALLAACGDDVAPGSDAASTDGAPASCEPGTPWAAAPPTLHGPTQETAVVALAGKIYVLGGFDDTLDQKGRSGRCGCYCCRRI